MFNRLVDMIGPYGGTDKSEFSRPVKMALVAILVLAIMIVLFVVTLLLSGQFIGPVLLIAHTLLSKQHLNPEKAKANKWLGYFSIVLTAYTIYVGGFPLGWEIGEGKLWLWVARVGSISIPIWVDSIRWILVILLVGSEVILLFLEARLLTEVVFPSLPNSVRARPGTLSHTFPYMQIRNDEPEDDIMDDGSVVPESGDNAPWR